ncbi:MAG TPA: DUF58 domain-containing protein [Polyangiaceae bacterium]|jgi:uncharacterized protein (DUF58 family)|nr:MAG: hypothetical protein BWY17_02409 [Deltaproteobacteria bacterium ADurb.Bin207]HNZ21103.1 DUF58 domain-containing protein [Polyangiaceae bacterium]HOD24727.1 DUF58 domain-containing protein [Polyangiaceae bacterium]HOE47873.1 DUF58 domain-containing protein [Polyangiaceae bacterium]HOG98973.1 DUF58 domain-containing protein [Polyangiaceae bacterium]
MIPKELLKQLRKIEFVTAKLANEELSGSYTSVFKGQGLAFRDVRQYQRGDDVRKIDWNVTARMNEPFVKVFVEERELTVMLVVDASGSSLFGTVRAPKSQVAGEVAALAAFSAIHNNDRVGLVLASDHLEKLVPPKKGEKHVLRVVREILAFQPQSHGTNLAIAFETLVKVARRRSLAFVISDFFDDGFERAMALASAKHDIIPVMLVDPRDESLPDVGLATFEDLESGESITVDTSDARVREHYAQSMKAVRDERIRVFRKHKLDLCVVRTDGSFVAPLRDLFAHRAKRVRSR